METDQQLVARIRAGEEAALSALYERYVNRIYGYVYSRVGNREEAEDLTSEIFVQVLRQLVRLYRGDGPLEHWLLAIARQVVNQAWRKRCPTCPLELAEDRLASPAEDTEPDPPDKRGRVQQVLEQLPPRYRQVLELRFFQGLDTREVASALGTRAGTARVLIHRALRAAAGLGGLGDEE